MPGFAGGLPRLGIPQDVAGGRGQARLWEALPRQELEQSGEPASGSMGSATLRSHRPRLGSSTGAPTRAPPTGTRAVSHTIR